MPGKPAILGLDEHTALIIDFASGMARISGKGAITLIRGEDEQRFSAGSTFPLTLLGKVALPFPFTGHQE
ncbi:MAG: hypothetical protein ACK8QZ_03985 [Anaerolineales bacterium]